MARRLIVLGALGALALAIAARLLGRRDPAPGPSLGPPPPTVGGKDPPRPAKAKPAAKPKAKAEPAAKTTGVTGYCVKDKKKVEIQNPKAVETKNGRPAIRGKCPECGGSIFRLGKLP